MALGADGRFLIAAGPSGGLFSPALLEQEGQISDVVRKAHEMTDLISICTITLAPPSLRIAPSVMILL